MCAKLPHFRFPPSTLTMPVRPMSATCKISVHRPRFARWRSFAAGLPLSHPLWNWLADRHSLTARLTAASGHFRVQRLVQHQATCLADEASLLAVSRRSRVIERDVLLRCDETPVVFAHTVMAHDASRGDWPYFAVLGNRSIGSRLFSDPAVQGGVFEFARLHPDHPLMLRAASALGQATLSQPLYARRRLFRRKRGLLMITEVFLDSPLWTRVRRS